MAGGRRSRGRQKIPMRLIEKQDDLYATFSKRRVGLYKKASMLTTLCDVDIGVIIFSPTLNPHSFFHPSLESVVDRYRNPDQPPGVYARSVESTTRSRIDELNRRLDEILDEKERVKEHVEEMELSRDKAWWEVESERMEQVKELIAWFQDSKAQLQTRIQHITNGPSSSSSHPLLDHALLMSQDAPFHHCPPGY